MTEPTTNEAWLDKVRKLLAKAEDPACTPPEAEAFTAKAVQLIARYGIDMALLATRPGAKDEVEARWFTVEAPYAMAKVSLLAPLAKAMGCQAIRTRSKGANERLHLIGYTSDLDRIELLYTSLLVQLALALAADWKSQFLSNESGVKEYRRAFMLGYGARVVARVREAEEYARNQAKADRVTGTSTALVLVDRSKAVELAFRRMYPKVTKYRPSTGSGGFSRGEAAGDRADLGGTRFAGANRRAIGA